MSYIKNSEIVLNVCRLSRYKIQKIYGNSGWNSDVLFHTDSVVACSSVLSDVYCKIYNKHSEEIVLYGIMATI